MVFTGSGIWEKKEKGVPSLQLCNFKEVDLQLLPTIGNALTCKVLLQKSEFADM